MKSMIVIPARMESSRLPGKPLLMAGGKSLLQWTYERAKQVGSDAVFVGSSDREVIRHCLDHDIKCMKTGEHPTGTHRVAEIESRYVVLDVIINWQVDEPLVPPAAVRGLIDQTWEDRITTLSAPIQGEMVDDPNIVKVVVGARNRCHWFSRAGMAGALAHCGVYGFPRNILERLGKISPSKLSLAELLEQLTWLEDNQDVLAFCMPELPLSINTPADWIKFKELVEG